MPSWTTHSVAHKSFTSVARCTITPRLKLLNVHVHGSGHFKRFASSSINSPSTGTNDKEPSSRPAPLTLLHKTRNLLPRVLGDGLSCPQRSVEEVHIWDSILGGAYDDLSIASERSAKILVCGLDEWSGAEELVTALLLDPLSSDAVQNDALSSRWLGHSSQKIQISYNTKSECLMSSSLKLSSSYLSQFSIPVEILELRSPAGSSSQPPKTRETHLFILQNPALFQVDIPIIICNPLSTPLDVILKTQLPTNTILILTSSMSQAELDRLVQRRLSDPSSSGIQLNDIHIIPADASKALHAIQVLQAQPKDLSAILKYQTDFVGSQISKITNAINTILNTENFKTTRKKMGLAHLQDALRWSGASLRQVRHELDQAFIHQNTLKECMDDHKAKIAKDIFGGKDEASEDSLNAVSMAIKQAEQDMRWTMDRLTWWKMVWRVDEISSIVSAAVARSWCNDLEKKLILQTGRLSVLQDEMSASAFTLLSNHPTVSTAVLRNELLQVERTPGYKLTADSLTRPIYSRRNQIMEHSTMRLHLTGQRVMIGMSGGILSGTGIGWAGWLGWLLGSGEGLLGFVGMDAGTAMGVGMLTAAASVQWAVGRWEKSKQQWWQDWARVGEGLDRDLKAKLQEMMQQRILIMGETACQGILQSIQRREEEVAAVGAELEEVGRDLDTIRAAGEKAKAPKP